MLAVPVPATIDQEPPTVAFVNAAVVAFIQTLEAPSAITATVGKALIVNTAVTPAGSWDGLELVIFILYNDEVVAPLGIVTLKVCGPPTTSVVTDVPGVPGNAPAEVLNSAVKTFPPV